MGKYFLLLLIANTAVSCSSKSDNQTPQEIFFVNKSKWEASTSNIQEYKITIHGSGMTGYYKSIVVFQAQTNSVLSCELEKRSWDEASSQFSDCMTQTNYHLNVEYYFDYLSDMIANNDLAQYEFNKYGVPVFALGSIEPLLADSGRSGFKISFEIVK